MDFDYKIILIMLAEVSILYYFIIVKQTALIFYMPLIFFMMVEYFFQTYFFERGIDSGLIFSFFIYLFFAILYISIFNFRNNMIRKLVDFGGKILFHLWSIYFLFQIIYFGIKEDFASIQMIRYIKYVPSVIDAVLIPFRDVQIVCMIIVILINQYVFIKSNSLSQKFLKNNS